MNTTRINLKYKLATITLVFLLCALYLLTVYIKQRQQLQSKAFPLKAVPEEKGSSKCASVNDSQLYYKNGGYLNNQKISTGFNEFGYNYGSGSFNGNYYNFILVQSESPLPPFIDDEKTYLARNSGATGEWSWQFRDVKLSVNWNESFLSSKDCNKDGFLDRASDSSGSYLGTDAWVTMHADGKYNSSVDDTQECTIKDFVKLVAAPKTAYLNEDVAGYFGEGVYFDSKGGQEIGPALWRDFIVVQSKTEDTCSEFGSTNYSSPLQKGLKSHQLIK